MVKLGFSTESNANSDSNERVLLYDIWRLLEGDQKEEINIDDLKILIMSIIKISDYKQRINVYPSEELQEYAKEGFVGYFNCKG